jgi:hypothetical protein
MSGLIVTFCVALAAGIYVGRLERKVKKNEPIQTLWGPME